MWHPITFSLLGVLLSLGLTVACGSTPTPTKPPPPPTSIPTKPPPPPASTPTIPIGSISGRVASWTDLKNPGKPVANARVEALDLPGAGATTDSGGYYILSNVPNGEHFLYASSQYGSSNIITVVVNQNFQTVDIGFYPIAIAGNLYFAPNEGRVVAPDGKPIAGATVWVLRTAPFSVSNPDGSFQLSYLDNDDIVVAATADRWGYQRYDSKIPLKIVLTRQPPMPIPPRSVYDCIAHAAEATWRNGSNAPVWNLPDNDVRGFALWRQNSELEDGTRPSRVLETHPQWIAGGTIIGSYPQVLTPQEGDFFVVRYGFLKGGKAGKVKFFVTFIRETDNANVPILQADLVYREGVLIPRAVIPFSSETIDKRGRIQLRVDAGDSSAQDWAAWAEAQIIGTK